MCCRVLIYGSYGILVNLSVVDGVLPYNSASVVLLVEITKVTAEIKAIYSVIISLSGSWISHL